MRVDVAVYGLAVQTGPVSKSALPARLKMAFDAAQSGCLYPFAMSCCARSWACAIRVSSITVSCIGALVGTGCGSVPCWCPHTALALAILASPPLEKVIVLNLCTGLSSAGQCVCDSICIQLLRKQAMRRVGGTAYLLWTHLTVCSRSECMTSRCPFSRYDDVRKPHGAVHD